VQTNEEVAIKLVSSLFIQSDNLFNVSVLHLLSGVIRFDVSVLHLLTGVMILFFS
jgi:hypothetical protein